MQHISVNCDTNLTVSSHLSNVTGDIQVIYRGCEYVSVCMYVCKYEAVEFSRVFIV